MIVVRHIESDLRAQVTRTRVEKMREETGGLRVVEHIYEVEVEGTYTNPHHPELLAKLEAIIPD